MKKRICFIILIASIFSCNKNSEPKVDPVIPVGKPAVKLYFSEDDIQFIGVIDLSKINAFDTLLSYEKNQLGIPGGITINHQSKRLYITEQTTGNRILRINLDSTLYRVVYDSDRGISNPTSIAVDTLSKKIYWANSGSAPGSGQIMVGDLFGSIDPVALFGGAFVFDNCYGIAIDNKNNKIYFADNNRHEINVGNLDGTGTPTKIYDSNNADNIGCPSSLLLSDGNLYWADDCFSNILRAPADGKEKPVVLFGEADGVSYAAGIAIDRASKKIYWSETDSQVIARGNLDGTGDREIILENIHSIGIALDFP